MFHIMKLLKGKFMIKVLNKMFSILEDIVIESPNPVSAGKLAEKFGINKATCSRIMGDLVGLGYIKQVSRMKGYVAGPRAYSFGQQVSYRQDVIDDVDLIIEECAKTVGESVLFAELFNKKRYILCHHNYNTSVNISLDKLAYDDLYETATGIMLLAHADREVVDSVIEEKGLPTYKIWPEVSSKKDVYDFLESIKDGYVFEGETENNFSIASFPVYRNGKCVFVIGVSVPYNQFKGEHKDYVLKKVLKAAIKISKKISTVGVIG